MTLLTYFYLGKKGGVHVSKRDVHLSKEGVHLSLSIFYFIFCFIFFRAAEARGLKK